MPNDCWASVRKLLPTDAITCDSAAILVVVWELVLLHLTQFGQLAQIVFHLPVEFGLLILRCVLLYHLLNATVSELGSITWCLQLLATLYLGQALSHWTAVLIKVNGVLGQWKLRWEDRTIPWLRVLDFWIGLRLGKHASWLLDLCSLALRRIDDSHILLVLLLSVLVDYSLSEILNREIFWRIGSDVVVDKWSHREAVSIGQTLQAGVDSCLHLLQVLAWHGWRCVVESVVVRFHPSISQAASVNLLPLLTLRQQGLLLGYELTVCWLLNWRNPWWLKWWDIVILGVLQLFIRVVEKLWFLLAVFDMLVCCLLAELTKTNWTLDAWEHLWSRLKITESHLFLGNLFSAGLPLFFYFGKRGLNVFIVQFLCTS